MPATKRHPFEALIGETLDAVDRVGTENLTDQQSIVLGFHWMAQKMNGKRSKRQWAALSGGAVTGLGTFGVGIGFGVAQALGG